MLKRSQSELREARQARDVSATLRNPKHNDRNNHNTYMVILESEQCKKVAINTMKHVTLKPRAKFTLIQTQQSIAAHKSSEKIIAGFYFISFVCLKVFIYLNLF